MIGCMDDATFWWMMQLFGVATLPTGLPQVPLKAVAAMTADFGVMVSNRDCFILVVRVGDCMT